MSDPYLGEIQAFPFNFALQGFNGGGGQWLPCLGQILPIQAYPALFALIGTTYGGNGTSNFALPNLGGFITISQGQGPGLSDRVIGETVGAGAVGLASQHMAAHTHALQLGSRLATGATAGPGNGAGVAVIDPDFNGFANPPSNATLAPNVMSFTGSSHAHDNNQPTLALVWCIAITGIFPSFSSS